MGRDVVQRAIILAFVVVGAVLCLLPTALRESFTQTWFTRPLALGLDISGGVHLAYRVKANEAVTSQLQGMLSSARVALRNKKVAVSQGVVTPKNTLEITLLSTTFLEDAKKVLAEELEGVALLSEERDGDRPRLVFGFSEQRVREIEREAIQQSVETLRNRVDQFGVAEPLIQTSGENRILLQMPGISDVQKVKQVVGSVAKLEFKLVADSGRADGKSTVVLKDRQNKPVVVESETLMTGAAVSDARVDFTATREVEVSLLLNSVGAREFERITSEHVGRQLAIVLDNTVYSSPVIREAIAGGRASITGGFKMDDARQLKIVLKAGALPASLDLLEERTVGPTLGRQSVLKGLFAMAVGFVTIAFFMVVYYAKSGLIAVGTLLLNGLLMVAALSLFGGTLTLPGLAGLALTIGMAVDSNVIIFERIRDEVRNGVGRDLAVHTGFDKAFSAIIDANITTLLSGVILYGVGTGPVRGFAVTLSIGVLTTLFCAVFVSRLCFDHFELKGKRGLSI
jgi:preprotein translocase subunit SecD